MPDVADHKVSVHATVLQELVERAFSGFAIVDLDSHDHDRLVGRRFRGLLAEAREALADNAVDVECELRTALGEAMRQRNELRTQNEMLIEHSRVLVNELDDAWWTRAARSLEALAALTGGADDG